MSTSDIPNIRPWHYDEFQQIGKDYSDAEEVAIYDSSHADFRDIKQEANTILDRLNPSKEEILVDFGCGTGIFAIEAARRCTHVYAVDISTAMLKHAEQKAKESGLTNITFIHAGYLTFECNKIQPNFITSTFSFHHLPDFWKGIALQRIHKMLAPGGKLYLHDVVLHGENPLGAIQDFIQQQTQLGGDFLKDDAETHFREEFSTYDWVMDGMLTRAGFSIQQKLLSEGVFATYYCKKL